jgi:hypothetical protein
MIIEKEFVFFFIRYTFIILFSSPFGHLITKTTLEKKIIDVTIIHKLDKTRQNR